MESEAFRDTEKLLRLIDQEHGFFSLVGLKHVSSGDSTRSSIDEKRPMVHSQKVKRLKNHLKRAKQGTSVFDSTYL